jgi:hypothetical protein
MEVGQGPKVGCSAKGKKKINIGQVLAGYEAGWVPDPVWTLSMQNRKLFPCRGVEPVAPHYTDSTIPALS